MGTENKTYSNKEMLKSIIKILTKPKISRTDVSLAWARAKKLDKDLKWNNFRTVVGRDQYVTKAMKKVTKEIDEKLAKSEMAKMEKMRADMEVRVEGVASNDKKIKAIVKKRDKIFYAVHFRVLTKVDPKNSSNLKLSLFEAPTDTTNSKSRRSTKINGETYSQIGREYAFETSDKWFVNNFKANGTKKDYIIRATRGEKGSRWNRTVLPVMKVLEKNGANHIISYMDAIYIPRVTSSANKAIPRTSKSKKSTTIRSRVFTTPTFTRNWKMKTNTLPIPI